MNQNIGDESERQPGGSALGVRAFRAFWIAALASNIGSWLQYTGASWLMTSLDPSPRMIALVTTASTLPVVLLGLPAGAIADIAGRRRVLLSMQWAMLGAAALLGALTLSGHIGPWSLLALTFALGLANALSAPASAAAVPEMVPPALLSSAVTLNSVQFNAARATGPALAGALLLLTGPGGLFLVNALSFAGMIWVVGQWTRQPYDGLGLGIVWRNAREGVEWVRGDAAVRRVVLRVFLFVIAAAGPWALLPVVAKQELNTSGGGFGLMLGAIGSGAVLVGIPFSVWRDRIAPEWFLGLGTCAFAAAMAALAQVRTLAQALWLLLLMGAAWITVMSTLNVAAQSAIPNRVRARVLSIYQLVFNLAFALASSFWGDFAARFGVRRTLAVCAGLVAASALTSWIWPIGRTSAPTAADQVQESALR